MKALELMTRFGRTIEGIVHVGANKGQEARFYRQLDGVPCVFVEPIPAVFEELRQEASLSSCHYAINALCSDSDGEEVTFHIANNGGEASSMLPASAHLDLFPTVEFTSTLPMVTSTLDTVLEPFAPALFNLLVIDAQGAELKILGGASESLMNLDGIFTEVSEVPLYERGATLEALEAYLRPLGFMPKWLEINQFRYGDAFFLKETIAKAIPEALGPNVALNKPASTSSMWWGAPAAIPGGGNNGTRTGGFGFHTAEEDGPWWQIDLGQEESLREVRVYNRLDSSADRARSLRILASSDNAKWTLIHDQRGRRFGGIDGNPLRVQFQDLKARYIKLTTPGKQYLHLDEVEIY